MDLLMHYLRDFNRDYLASRADRRRTLENLGAGLGILALLATIALLLWNC